MLNLKGAESEAMFVYVALKQRWEILGPLYCSPYAYDFVIRRHSKKWETVQVKTARNAPRAKNQRGKSQTRMSMRRNSKNGYKRYERGDFDLLCVVYYDDMWLIPWEKIQNNGTVMVSSKRYDAYKIDLNRGTKPKVAISRIKNDNRKIPNGKGIIPLRKI